MFEKERMKKVGGKTYIMQNPMYNNCVVVALFNAFLDDDQSLDLEKLYREEKALNKKYDIDNRGLQITMVGDLAWKYGYQSSLDLAPGLEVNRFRDKINEGQKVLRIYGWKRFVHYESPALEKKCKNYVMDFVEKYPKYKKKVENRKIVTGASGLGSYVFFVRKIHDDGKFHGINYTTGVNWSKGWYNIGLEREKQKKGVALGSELAIILKRK